MPSLFEHFAVAVSAISGVLAASNKRIDLRDVLVGQIPLVFRREIFLYATAAFCGATGYVLLERSCPGLPLNRLVGIGTTLLLRLVAIQWRLSLPVFKS